MHVCVCVCARAHVSYVLLRFIADYARKANNVIDYDLINSCRASHYILSSKRWKTLIRTVETGRNVARVLCMHSEPCHRNQLTSLQGTTITSECAKVTGESEEIAMSTGKTEHCLTRSEHFPTGRSDGDRMATGNDQPSDLMNHYNEHSPL